MSILAQPWSWEPAEADADHLRAILVRSATRPAAPGWHELPHTVRELHPRGAAAVIGYGSWYTEGLRKPTSFADCYLVVDDYAAFHRSRFHAWMNRALPPNVYFLWSDGPGHRSICGKFSVISRADLRRECSPRLRDLYSAGRLSRLIWIAWACDDTTHAWLMTRLLDAQLTLTPLALGLLADHFSLEDFSHELLGLSYRGEPRLEGWDKVHALRAAHEERYAELHRGLLESFAASTSLLEVDGARYRRRRDPRWTRISHDARRTLRRSRRRGYLRWPRILLTEPHWLDLAVDEAERKAGVRIQVTPVLRAHPLLRGLPEFLRVLRARRGERIRRRDAGARRP